MNSDYRLTDRLLFGGVASFHASIVFSVFFSISKTLVIATKYSIGAAEIGAWDTINSGLPGLATAISIGSAAIFASVLLLPFELSQKQVREFAKHPLNTVWAMKSAVSKNADDSAER